jgi:branched-chain amino acid transport system substrate-binding protein
MKFHKFSRLTLAGVIACGVLVAFSSSAIASSKSKKAGNEINIGAIGSFSGPFASSTGGIPKVLAAWQATVNAGGGINGHKVRVITDDAGLVAGTDLTEAKTLIGQDHVVAIIDMDSSDSVWLPYAKTQGVPVIVGLPGVSNLTDADSFPIMGSAVTIGYAVLRVAKTYGTKLGLVYCAEGCSPIASVLGLIATPLGMTIPVSVSASSTAPDYTATCQSLISGGVNSYLLQFAAAAATEITDQCSQQGLSIPTILEGPNSVPSWKSDPAFNNDPVIDAVTPYFENKTPAQKLYRSSLKKYAASIVGSPTDNSYSLYAWLCAQLIAAAVQNVKGTITAARLTNGMYSLKNETLGGMTQRLNFVKGQATSLDCYFTWKISGGKFVTGPKGNSPICASAAVLAPIISILTTPAGG